MYFNIDESAKAAEERGISRVDFDKALKSGELPATDLSPHDGAHITEENLQAWFDRRRRVPSKKTTFDLPGDVHRALRWGALKSERSMRDLVLRYIEEGLERDGMSPTKKS